MSLSSTNSIQSSTTLTSSSVLSNAGGSQTVSLALTSTLTSLVSTSTAPSSSSQGPPGISKSSSLLFGFLVTFLALFVTFMACGFGGRRALDFRRRRMAGNLDLTGSLSRLVKPKLWDVWIEAGEEKWAAMLPLSACTKRSEELERKSRPEPISASVEPELPPQEHFSTFMAPGGRGIARITATPTYNPAIWRGTSLHPSSLTPPNAGPTLPFTVPDAPSWLPFLTQSRKQIGEMDKITEEDVESLQVSVLIAMPTPRRSKAAEAEIHEESTVGDLGEFALGVTAVPWIPSFNALCFESD